MVTGRLRAALTHAVPLHTNINAEIYRSPAGRPPMGSEAAGGKRERSLPPLLLETGCSDAWGAGGDLKRSRLVAKRDVVRALVMKQDSGYGLVHAAWLCDGVVRRQLWSSATSNLWALGPPQ